MSPVTRAYVSTVDNATAACHQELPMRPVSAPYEPKRTAIPARSGFRAPTGPHAVRPASIVTTTARATAGNVAPGLRSSFPRIKPAGAAQRRIVDKEPLYPPVLPPEQRKITIALPS